MFARAQEKVDTAWIEAEDDVVASTADTQAYRRGILALLDTIDSGSAAKDSEDRQMLGYYDGIYRAAASDK